MKDVEASPSFTASMTSSFVAPRRQRPYVKIYLSDLPLRAVSNSPGFRAIVVNQTSPHFKQTLFDQVYSVLSGFMEGRDSLKSISTPDFEFIEMTDLMVDITEAGKNSEQRFKVLQKYITPNDLDELAKRLSSVYAIDVAVVEGQNCGLVVRRIPNKSF